MRGKAARLAVAATAAIAVSAGGCGGDDSTTSSVTSSADATSGTVSTEEFITAADARCAEANAAIANLSSDTAASATTVEQELNITRQTLKGLKSLGSPEDPDGSLADYYAAVKQEISLLGQEQSALATGDTVSVQAVTAELDQARSDARDAAQSFGFEECGRQGSPIDSGDTTSGGAEPTTTTTAPTVPTTTVPVTPTTTAPVAPPPSGGTSGGTGTGGGGTGTGGGGGSSGGISPGG
jgi:hypothetical protein